MNVVDLLQQRCLNILPDRNEKYLFREMDYLSRNIPTQCCVIMESGQYIWHWPLYVLVWTKENKRKAYYPQNDG